jgi:hypothetical protein
MAGPQTFQKTGNITQKLRERIGVDGGAVVLRVGGATDLELKRTRKPSERPTTRRAHVRLPWGHGAGAGAQKRLTRCRPG